MLEKEFSPEKLYNKIIKYYMDKKGYNKERANTIAQRVVQRETKNRICAVSRCGHFSHDHLRNTGVCLLSRCACSGFLKKTQAA